MKIAIAQINTTVASIENNKNKIIENIKKAKQKKADLIVFPEMTITGYPPRDLLERKSFVDAQYIALESIIAETDGIAAVIGFCERNENPFGRGLYNSAAFIENKELKKVYRKSLLPTYDVFDEDRHFESSKEFVVFDFKGKKLGLSICEDIWYDHSKYNPNISSASRNIYHINPIEEIHKLGADFIINISASPYNLEKKMQKLNLLKGLARNFKASILYCNLVGGNDELVFDGNSLFINENGDIVANAKGFEEDFLIVDTESKDTVADSEFLGKEYADLLDALKLGLSDYMQKTGFKQAVIGISGGIDSALVVAITSMAIGSENVFGLLMPSPYSSEGSINDSVALCENLGVSYEIIKIADIFEAYKNSLAETFTGKEEDVTEENIQARIRGNLLMAVSNKFRRLVISTGNKSELAVGYCTLYGDMSGGIALISDLYKTTVYELCKYINKDKEIIPTEIITKPPSAELKPDQKDQDTLPSYDLLDSILKKFIEKGMSIKAIVEKTGDEALVKKIVRMIEINEYKRRQATIGIRVTAKAFGMGRRVPIAKASFSKQYE